MNEGDQCDLFKFFMIIMSSKTKEEQQREVLHYLRSNPNSLHTLIRHGIDKFNKELNYSETDERIQNSVATMAKQTNVRLCETNEKSLESRISSMGDNQTKGSLDQYVSTCVSNGKAHVSSDLTRCCFFDNPDRNNIQGKSTQPSKKRKSKYGDIQGDLSHIHREPKCATINRNARPKRKYTRRRPLPASRNDKDDVILDQDECDVILVQKLMKMLLHPKSPEQQEYIVCLLKSDERLTKIFIEEKANLGKTNIPVFKMRESVSDAAHYSTNIEQHTIEHHGIIDHGEGQQFVTDGDNEIDDNSTFSLVHFLSTYAKTSDFVATQNEDEHVPGNNVDYMINLHVPTDNHEISSPTNSWKIDSNPYQGAVDSVHSMTFATNFEEQVQELTLL